MRAKQIHEQDGEQTFTLVFDTGDEVISELTRFAESNGLDAASLTAIGAFSSAMLGYFDVGRKEYEKIPVEEQVEVLSLVGDIASKEDGEPQVARSRSAWQGGWYDQGWSPPGGPRPSDAGGCPSGVPGASETRVGRGGGARADKVVREPKKTSWGS